MFSAEGIPTREDNDITVQIETITDGITFQNSNSIAHCLFHKDKEAAIALYEELSYWVGKSYEGDTNDED